MPVNFSNLVLRPGQQTFARPLLIDPQGSRPGDQPYMGRGVVTATEFAVQSMDGAVLSDRKVTMSFRIADFDGNPPAPKDIITDAVDGRRWIIDDATPDDQGAIKATIRSVTPDYPR